MELGQKNSEGQRNMENLNEELQMVGLTWSSARRLSRTERHGGTSRKPYAGPPGFKGEEELSELTVS